MDRIRSWISRRYNEMTIAGIVGVWCWYYPFGKCYVRVPKRGKSRNDGFLHIIVVDVEIVTDKGIVSLRKIAEQNCSQFKGRRDYEESISNCILSLMREFLGKNGFKFDERKTKSSELECTDKKFLLKNIKGCFLNDVNVNLGFIIPQVMGFCCEVPNKKVGVDVFGDLSFLLKNSTEPQQVIDSIWANSIAENKQAELEIKDNEQLSTHSLDFFGGTNNLRGFTQNNSGSE